jgi:hypothetical protein
MQAFYFNAGAGVVQSAADGKCESRLDGDCLRAGIYKGLTDLRILSLKGARGVLLIGSCIMMILNPQPSGIVRRRLS